MKFDFGVGRIAGATSFALGMVFLASVSGVTASPAQAQGTLSPQPKQNDSCPYGWSDRQGTQRTNTCYPNPRSKAAYWPAGRDCRSGYVKTGRWCLEGEPNVVLASAASVRKAHPLDRCPVGFFTLTGNGELCTSNAESPPTIRLKGDGPCAANEIEDWGLWCVSNYAGLTRQDAAKGFPDYNGIYRTSFTTTGRTSTPNQADLPEGKEYTPAYFVIFGRVDREGNPIGGAASAAAASSPGSVASTAANAAEEKQCEPAPTRRRGLGGLGRALGAAVGVEVPAGGGC